MEKSKGKTIFTLILVLILSVFASYKAIALAEENKRLISEHQTLRKELKSTIKEKKKLNDQLLEKQKETSKKQEKIKALEKKVDKLEKDLQAKKKEEEQWQTFTATYYDANYQSTGKNPGDKGYGTTASGRKVQEGVTIAVDPNIIPLGTWVLIQYPDGRIEKRRADDTGSAIKGKKIDIYIPKASV